ncbi:MAG TPA: aldo/keto reductase [Tepidisphaeraceae bacterium]|jgi:predicted dehydrogenase/aryl-alcohol dehydrogenase-like predicted oxidoreductase|nr:aldo/keto reductase [Tepidisphaeraceae bacterium]
MDHLNWGIIGTGAIAKAFAQHLLRSRTGKLVAVGSREKSKGEMFAKEHGALRGYGSYEEVLGDEEVQAVYVAVPHVGHAEWTIKACEAGKHVLCEKPMGVNAAEAMVMIEAARAHGVFLMEAFMYRCTPQTRKVIEMIRQGVIGEVRVIQAAFSFHWPANLEEKNRITENTLAGGGILDVGCYPVSFARLIAGVARGKEFAEPTEVKASGRVGKTGVDEWACAVMKFPGDIVAEVSCGVQVSQENSARVYGSKGWIELPAPWVPARDGGKTEIVLHVDGKEERVEVESRAPIYAIEADWVAESIEEKQGKWPGMSWDETMGNMRVLDLWRKEIGLVYEVEKVGKIKRFGPSKPQAAKMTYGEVEGVGKRVARLVMGCDNQPNLPYAAAMFDDYMDAGGNAFDTAHIYGGGLQEKLFGEWVRTRGVREEIVVIAKGAHTPYCYPEIIGVQLEQSLERMGLESADIYMMHRDNVDVPVGEFVEAMNEQVNRGRMKAFGGSNWSVDRVREGNAYAKQKGLMGFAAVSNNFSLARLVEPMWAGCISASDEKSRAFFRETGTALFAWSSQARGFFVEGKAGPEKREDGELVRCWYSEDNFRRLERVKELARKREVLPINIALAWVLNQPMEAFALIGPRTIRETHTSWAALEVGLSESEIRWLNLEE